MKQLNGWQRIFIVLSVVWLACCLSFGVYNWPTETNHRAVVSIRALPRVPDAFTNAQANLDCVNRHKRDGGGFSFEECNVEGIAAVKPEDKRRYDELIAKGEERMPRVLLRDRAKVTVVCVGAWLLGSLLFYLIVWGLYRVLRWVVQGFRKPT